MTSPSCGRRVPATLTWHPTPSPSSEGAGAAGFIQQHMCRRFVCHGCQQVAAWLTGGTQPSVLTWFVFMHVLLTNAETQQHQVECSACPMTCWWGQTAQPAVSNQHWQRTPQAFRWVAAMRSWWADSAIVTLSSFTCRQPQPSHASHTLTLNIGWHLPCFVTALHLNGMP